MASPILKQWAASVSLAACMCGNLGAAEITAKQAVTAVRNWRAREFAPLGAALGTTVRGVSTLTNAFDKTPVFHVVTLEGGGYVVTSADDGILPVIAFSKVGGGAVEADSPLYAMLTRDLAGRKSAAAVRRAPRGHLAVPKARDPESPEAQWAELLDERGGIMLKSLSSVSDTRVSPLVQSHWGQSTVGGFWGNYPCYNYYTPYGYPAGCVATAMAQVMRYHRYPTASVPAQIVRCVVDGKYLNLSMLGGTYAWSNMVLQPDEGGDTAPSEGVRAAIGKLCYDCGVSVGMQYASDSSSSFANKMPEALKGTFRYASACMDSSVSESDIRNGVLANLDCGHPIIMSISGAGGHAAVADGYGFSGSARYIHLNMGWNKNGNGGYQNLWYSFPEYGSPDVNTALGTFSYLDGITYNIIPSSEKKFLSGRVLSASGAPVPGAKVTCNGTTGTADSKGIYNFFWSGTASSVSATLSATGNGWKSGETAVTVKRSTGSTPGNVWGKNIVLTQKIPYTVTLFANGGSGGTASITAYVGETLPYGQIKPARAGYAFQGYWDTSAASGGTQYYGASMYPVSVWHDVGDTTLYARWTANSYTVYFNANGGSIGTSHVTATFDSSMPAATKPSRAGYTFQGYWDTPSSSGGSQYYTASMTSARAWNKAATGYLYARWAPASYVVTLYLNGGVNGSDSVVAKYLADMPAATAPTRAGYIFQGYYDSSATTGGTQYYTASMASARAWDKTSAGTLYARWAISPANALDDSAGYAAWKTETGGVYRVYVSAGQGYPTNSSAAWYAQTTVTGDGTDALRSGVIGDGRASYFETTMTGPKVVRFWWKVSSEAGFDYLRFFIDGAEQIAISGETGWQQKAFVIQSGSHTLTWGYTKDAWGVASGSDCGWVDMVSVGTDYSYAWLDWSPYVWYVLKGAAYGAMPAPARPGYTFTGWRTGAGGTGTRIYDTTVVTADSSHNLYASWSPEWYLVSYDLGGTIKRHLSYVEFGSQYGSLYAPSAAEIPKGYSFSFWSAGLKGTGAQIHSWTTVSVPSNHTLYAVYSPNTYTVTFDAQGGTVSPESKAAVFDDALGTLPVPVWPGRAFVGWYTEQDGAGVVVKAATRLKDEGCTLYARWADPYLGVDPDVGRDEDSPSVTTAYEGFLTDALTNTVRGALSVTAKESRGIWSFTAKAALQDKTLSFASKGRFAEDGSVRMVSRTGEVLALYLGKDGFVGALSTLNAYGANAPLVAVGKRNAFADKKDAAAQARLAPLKGIYNLALTEGTPDIQSPESIALAYAGYLTLAIGNLGTVKIAGKLADGTAVSGSAKLLEGLNEDGWQAIVLFKPLYTQRGFIGGLLWLNPQDKMIRVDTAYGCYVDWVREYPMETRFAYELDVVGGYFGDRLTGTVLAGPLAFGAGVPDGLPPPVAGLDGAWAEAAFPQELPVTAIGIKLTLPKATAPKKAGYGPDAYYDYGGANPSGATLTYSAKTGLFKGSFKLYYDGFDVSGNMQHKAASVSYTGVMVPQAGGFTGLGAGTAAINRQKVAVPVWLEK